MTYNDTLEYLYNSTPVFERVGASAYKEGLYNTLQLDEHFNHPHRQYRTIHVAGTNGKGSTSHTLAAILQAEGYKVGLYTSPHLVDFAERIRINGEPIEHQYVVDFVHEHKAFFEPLHPSFFEIVTAMAFKYFADRNVDIAVVEVGLGGRLDCTNIITPILSIITNISYDHTALLGNTLGKIAAEKAGIIKQGIPVVVGEWNDETLPVFEETARRHDARLILADSRHDAKLILADSRQNADFQLKGTYQTRNLATILTAVRELQDMGIIAHESDAVSTGLNNVCSLTGLRGRWETIRQYPLVICDTGHNVAAWNYLSKQLADTHLERVSKNEEARMRIVFGMVDDKDIDTVLSLLPANAIYYFCQASTHRAIPAQTVKEKAERHGIVGEAFTTVGEAYETALAQSKDCDFIFVGGSSYVVADFLASI